MAIRRLEKVRSSDGEQAHVCVCVGACVPVGRVPDEYAGIFHVNHTSGKL